jgi:hypothetical protein
MDQQAPDSDFEMPGPRSGEKYSGRFVVHIPRSLHRSLAEMAEREGVAINLLVNLALVGLVDRGSQHQVSSEGGASKRKGILGTVSWMFGRGRQRPVQPSGSKEGDQQSDVAEVESEQDTPGTATGWGSRVSKYAPLGELLKRLPASVGLKSFTFSQIEQIIGARLPRSARAYRPWWANTAGSHVQASAWLDAGWEVDTVDQTSETVTFRRKP